MKQAIKEAVEYALETVGIEEFRKTSMFIRNRMNMKKCMICNGEGEVLHMDCEKCEGFGYLYH